MKKHCNNIVLAVALVACLSVQMSCHAAEAPATATNVELQQQGHVGVSDATTLVSYKLALQWPPGACSVSYKCKGDIPKTFTIFGLWPQNSYNYGVPPYSKDPSCTSLKPVPTDRIMGLLQKADLVEELTEAWPNLKNSKYPPKNQQFWEHQWEQNGMCTDFGDNPIQYFKTAINLRDQFVKVYQPPSGGSYKVKVLLQRVKNVAKATPEIVCRKQIGTNTTIVGELHLCYKKGNLTPEGIEDCKRPFSGICKSELDVVKFL
ncbi:hypothetical protein F3Y22_tig00000715pilonHSYRG00312 [Hibiscus syriacus]|uniref:Uncharacterized protein n=2 Tax=Hibiscus syriacus TaxID=106335 RepID=A0A6A3D086_HIBSY|nr:hypothetical protein F3Y22_tig00000715pilonHSYRG00312 [Hibiscus syriacus]